MTWEPWAGLAILLALIGFIAYEMSRPKTAPDPGSTNVVSDVPVYTPQKVSSPNPRMVTVWENTGSGWKAKETFRTPVRGIDIN